MPPPSFATSSSVDSFAANRVHTRIRTTILEMMTDRGYTKFEDTFCKKAAAPLLIASCEAERCYIFFSSDDKLRVKEVRKFQTVLEESSIRHCIIISNLGATSSTMSKLRQIDVNELEIEIFPYRFLMCNPTRHRLYRPHRALDAAEKSDILKKYNASEDQMPKLLRSDRICQYFNFSIGTVVEIIRSMESLGPYKTYRIVV